MSIPELATLPTSLRIGPVQSHRNLAVVPLIDETCGVSGFVTLERAVARGLTEVTEISEDGNVPRLKLLNRGPESVFLLDGEELAGAKQNRMLNLSILVSGNSELEIPVSCVEQGRWSWRSRGFSGTDRVMFSKLRRSNSESVSANLAASGHRDGNQGAVWSRIAAKASRMEVHSDTGAASALYEGHRQELDEFVGGVMPVDGQLGAAFMIDRKFAGLDILAGPDLLAGLLPKLVRSYALDAMEDEEAESGAAASAPVDTEVVREALQKIARMKPSRHPALGLGEDLRMKSGGLIGGALIAAGTLVHLGIWSADYQ